MEEPKQIKTYLSEFMKYINKEFSKGGCENCKHQQIFMHPYDKNCEPFTYCHKHKDTITEPSTLFDVLDFEFECDNYNFDYDNYDDNDQCYFFEDGTDLDILIEKLQEFTRIAIDWKKYLKGEGNENTTNKKG